MLRRTVRAFCEQELRPIAAQIDQEARFPWEVVEKMGRLGYFGIQAPIELGGAGLDALSYAVIIEETSRVSAAIGLCLSVHNSVALYPILAFLLDHPTSIGAGSRTWPAVKKSAPFA